ncbi:MAG: bifunctional diaminohydroxyphosphoribosylaminopyrimidine deaminase/5-amino-6-(5-phosphoribosylamino)uracil reductase RibD [Gemmatimonadota bacterium]|nr:bifunctional diaminohydroxyphosphoribosylaminopyrimidine deaminase/5-amino-6-(5-phosphoribosylamino)uracil reductase RibD [Gemmatimonadota bacterium]
MDARDIALMRRALDLAKLGWGQTAPNPMVGAVVVRGGVVVGEGYHARYGGDHAEVVALRAAGPLARGASVYVTLEPCGHAGKTPPCADALIKAGVSRVVAATRDPNPEATGGAEQLRDAGIDVILGIEEQAVRELNAPFFHAFRSDRPWITLKLAVSIDGAISNATRTAGWLTGAESRREVHRLRAGSDAVAVGSGTALADDPQLTVRDVPLPRLPPRRVVFDSRLRLPLSSRLVRTAREVSTTVVTTRPIDPADAPRAAALEAAGVPILAAESVGDALRALRADGVRSMLVEGGARLAGSLLAEGVVDRLIIFQAPVVLGPGSLSAFAGVPDAAPPSAQRLEVIDRATFGDDLMTVYAVNPA